MIEIIPDLPEDVIGFVAKGEVTRGDYENTLDPAVEAALESHDKIRLLYVLDADFEGMTGGAMWEDGSLGMKHLTRWDKIAVVTDKSWIRHGVEALGWVMPAKVKTFEAGNQTAARDWVTS